jgi:hypothetical protein
VDSNTPGRVGPTASRMVGLNVPSWNQLDGWLRQVEGLRRVA